MGAEKTSCGGVDCATGAGDECQWAEACPCWWGVQWRVKVKVSVHQDMVLSLLSFIIVLEAFSCKFRSGFSWEDLFANDLGIFTESLEECDGRLLTWKEAMEEKGLSNAGKTKIMICGTGLDPLQSSGEFPCAVWRTGVGSNIIFWNSCKHRVHKIAESSSAWQRTLITDVHSVKELHAAWTADHRGNSKSNLSSWGW